MIKYRKKYFKNYPFTILECVTFETSFYYKLT